MPERPQATNKATGETLEFDGQDWVPVQMAHSQSPPIQSTGTMLPSHESTTKSLSSPSLLDRVKSYIPSRRTTLRVGGAAIGGAAGLAGGTILGTPISGPAGAAIGGAVGGSIGESINQLLEPRAATSPTESLASNMEAQLQGGLQEGLPAAAIHYGSRWLGLKAADKVAESVGAAQQSKKVQRMTAKVAEPAIQEFPVRPTKNTLLNKLEDLAKESTRAVDNAYKAATASGMKIRSQPAIQALQQKVQQYYVQGTPIVGAEKKIEAYREVIDWLRAHPSFDANEFRGVKQVWDGIVQPKRNLGPFAAPDPAKIEALKEASDTARSVIHAIFPKTAAADAKAHTWITLANVLNESKGIGLEPLKQMVGRSTVGGTIGGLVNYERGRSPYEGAAIGAIVANLSQTALWNTLSVKERVMLMRALESETGKAALHAIAMTGSGAIEEMMPSPSGQ